MRYTAHVLHGFNPIEALETEWRDLFNQAESPNPFFSAEWMFTWLNHRGGRVFPVTLIVRDDDERLVAADVKLILAGEYYSNEVKYETMIDELGIRDRIIFHTRFVSNAEVRYFFGAADLVVQPYRTATQSGISQLAYHFEKPMVVTRVGGLPEIVPHGKAGYVIDQEASQLAEAVLDFYEHHRAADFRSGLQEQKQRFSWSGFVEVLEELFPA